MKQVAGFVMIPVVITISLIAVAAFLLNLEGAAQLKRTETRGEAEQVGYVAEAGLNHALWMVDETSCGPYNNLSSTSFGSHSYQATVTPENAGTFTSHSISVDQDTWLSEQNPDTNFGMDAEVVAKKEPGTDSKRALYRYDLSSIPVGAKIVSAIARFHVTVNDTKAPLTFHAVTADWTEMGATWNATASNFDAVSLVAIPTQTSSGIQIEVNLTPLLQAWVNAAIPNYGLMLMATSEGMESKYTSREWGTSAEQPALDVVTSTAPVASRATIAATGTLANGLQRQLIRTERPLYQSPSTVIYQPGAGLEDAFIWDGAQAGKNFGISPTFNISNDRNLLTRFALEALPPGARIISARLSLYLEGGSGVIDGVLDLHRLIRPWIEGIYDDQSPPAGAGVTYQSYDGQTNWDTSGGDYDPAVIDSVTLPTMVPGWYEWDVSEQVGAWLSGVPNYGFLLREGGGDAGDINFTSSDSPVTEHHPRLILTLACECGVACILPKGSGNVLLVVDDAANPMVPEQTTRMHLESWGYTINLISDDDTQANFDTAVANNEVVYVMATAVTALGIKLKDAPIGVVYEDGTLNDEFGVASGGSWPIGTDLNISNNTHSITAPFMSGELPIKTDRSECLTVSGTTAAGLQSLADVGGADSLVVLDQGAQLEGGGTAAGRRVMLPLGRDADYNWRYLNNNGRVIAQRALDWANPAPVCTETFADNFDTDLFTNSDGDFAWSGDWIEVDGDGAGPTSGNVSISGGRLLLDDRPDTGGQPSLAREASLSVFSAATLTFDYELGSSTDQGSDVAILEVSSDGGSTWTELQNFSSYSGGDVGSLSFDLTPYLAVKTHLRYRIDSGYGNPNEFLAIDNLKISLPCGEGPPATLTPLAHWKLDETSGTTAVDSVGGHDGTLLNGPNWAAGQDGGALDFDGSNDYISVPHDDNLSLTETLTIAAWINPEVIGSSYNVVVSKDDGGSGSNYWFGLWRGELTFGFWSGGVFREVWVSGFNLQAGSWQHIAASFDNSADEVRFYQDGSLVHTASLTFSPSALTTDLEIGRSPDGQYWRGLLDDVRLYDRVLNATEIANLASIGGGGGGGGGGSYFRDEFTLASFDNNDGTLNWSGPWLEIDGDGVGPGIGNVLISGGQLSLDDRPDTGGQPSLERAADLSTFTSAILSFVFQTGSGVDSNRDAVVVEVSADGGANWQVLEDFAPVGRNVSDTRSYDISPHISANTRIRFRITARYGGRNEYFLVDNVNIEVAGP